MRAQVHPHNYDQALWLMREANVERMVNVAGGPFGEILSTLIELGELSHNRIITASNVDWRELDAADFGTRAAHNLERAWALGARGLAVTAVLGAGVYARDGLRLRVDDPRLNPLWAKAAELQLPVWLDLRDVELLPAASQGAASESGQQDSPIPCFEDLLLERDLLVAQHPHTIFICTCLAGTPADLAGVATLLELFPNVYVDTAMSFRELGSLPTDQVRDFFTKYAHRILWSSGIDLTPMDDSVTPAQQLPLATARDLLANNRRYFETVADDIVIREENRPTLRVAGLGLPKPVLEQIYHLNAEHIFTLSASRKPRLP